MVWRLETSNGDEASKVKYEVLRYCNRGLDIGCGPRKVWPHLIGVDNLTDTKLFGIRMRPDIAIGDASRLVMFADQSFDTVFSSHTLEHIEDYRAALREWWRLLAPGGHLTLYLPHCDLYPRIGQPGANPDHKHDFAPEDIVAAMREIAPDWTLLVNETRDQDDEYSFLQVYRREKTSAGQIDKASEPKPEKSVGIVRVGGHGDALWASSVCANYKEQGYHVTCYVGPTGGAVLKHDPNIDDLVVFSDTVIPNEEAVAFWCHQAKRHTKFINLIGSVENRLLPHETSYEFFLPQTVRHRLMNANYLETVHAYADLPPSNFRQRYYPSAAEEAWAKRIRAELPGPVVVINPAGSGPVKYWPYTQRLMELLAARKVYSVALGDIRDESVLGVEPYGIYAGMEWPVRHALAYALQADAVVATESLIANAVAFEPMLKIVTLSHSSVENLTKHWVNTASAEPLALGCYPCHRVHPPNYSFCARDTTTKAAACQALARPEKVAELVLNYLEHIGKLEPVT
jgi:predicted SAM-dependent methyltransferase